jgi:hypothetical protein
MQGVLPLVKLNINRKPTLITWVDFKLRVTFPREVDRRILRQLFHDCVEDITVHLLCLSGEWRS